MKINCSTFSLSILFLVCSVRGTYGQDAHFTKLTYGEASSLSPQAFDGWIDSLYNNLDNIAGFQPDSIQACILNRFSKGLFTSDDAVLQGMRIINKHGGYHRTSYQKEMDYLDTVLGVLYKRDMLKIKLLDQRASIITTGRPFEKEPDNELFKLETYKAILSEVEPLSLEFNFLRMKYNFEVGDVLFKSMHNEAEADKHYTIVQTYPFWKIKDSDYLSKHRRLYIRAVGRRLEVNRGNLKVLERLDIIPSASELYPIWKASIEQLGGNWDDIFDN